jgi:hypothetical protein
MYVLIASPVYSKEVCADFLMSAFATAQDLMRRDIPAQLHVVTGLPFVDLARNRIVQHFLHNTNATDLLFIDSDQGWDYNAIPRVLASDEDIVVGLPPKRTDPPEFHSNALTGVMRNGLMQSLEGGTGFMRIKRRVFAKLDAAYPELRAGGKGGYAPYFQTKTIADGVQGEDIFFSRLWTGIGEHFWIDSDITFTHRGSHAWKGNFYEHAVDTGLLKVA